MLLPCHVDSAAGLDAKIREIFALDMLGRGDEITGTLQVFYSNEDVKGASLLPLLVGRGVHVEWNKA